MNYISVKMRALLICILALLATRAAAYRPLDHTFIVQQSDDLNKHKKDELNLRPLIGIVSQPGLPASKGSSYIAASYIKFVEAAGARAVPILHDMDQDEIARRFKAVNGILIPGGGQDLSPGHSFYDTVKLLWDMALDANDQDDFFPMHGTCLGFEVLAVIAAQNTSVLSSFDAENDPRPLFLTDIAESR